MIDKYFIKLYHFFFEFLAKLHLIIYDFKNHKSPLIYIFDWLLTNVWNKIQKGKQKANRQLDQPLAESPNTKNWNHRIEQPEGLLKPSDRATINNKKTKKVQKGTVNENGYKEGKS